MSEEQKTFKIQEISDWYKQFDNKKIKILGETQKFNVHLEYTGLPHLLGLHKTNFCDVNNKSIKGVRLLNYIKENNISDQEIFRNVRQVNSNYERSIRHRF